MKIMGFLRGLTLLAMAISSVAFTPVHQGVTRTRLFSDSLDTIATIKSEFEFTTGLAETLVRDSERTARRFYILDNSGSMSTPDGNRFFISSSDKTAEISPCTRWKELQESSMFYARLAGMMGTPAEFSLLNSLGIFGGNSFTVTNAKDAEEACRTIQRAEPSGATPLAQRVVDVRKKVQKMLPGLQESGKGVSLVISTDGLPTDSFGYGGEDANKELGRALESLTNLPIWTVIRICTDDEKVIEFYNDIDSRLEISLDVIDDFVAEAKEVKAVNKWLTYGLPLHRIREFGCRSRIFDLIDERKLTKDELRDFCGLVFGEAQVMDGMPDPQKDWRGFVSAVKNLQSMEEKVYDPLSKKFAAWTSFNPLLY